MSVTSISMLLIATGIASNNLLFAGSNGRDFQITKNGNCILILLLLFILQQEMLIFGNKIALTSSVIETSDKWKPLLVLISTGIIMLYKCFNKNWVDQNISLNKMQLLQNEFSTSLIVFSCSFALPLVKSNNQSFPLCITPLLMAFLVIGLSLGMLNKTKYIKWLHLIGVICFAFWNDTNFIIIKELSKTNEL